MGFFNRITTLFGHRSKAKTAAQAAPSIPAPVVRRSMKDYVTDLLDRESSMFRNRGYSAATHRTSYRTVAMDLRDAKKRRNIAKRKGH